MLINIRRKRKFSVFTILCLSLLLLSGSVYGAIVNTEVIVDQQQAQIDRDRLLQTLDREEIQDKLVRYGVDPEAAKARIAALTDQEIAAMQQKLDEMPAGSGAGEVILIILLVLIITDLLGVTNVFPFIRPL